MRQVVKGVVEQIKKTVTMSDKELSFVETFVEVYGHYDDIDKCINSLVNAINGDDKQKVDAVKSAYHLQRLLTKY